MTDLFIGRLLFAVLYPFVFMWGFGLIVRIADNPSSLQIRIAWFLRWLFGYNPVSRPVSLSGATFQLAAFLTFGADLVLALVWPSVLLVLYWLPLIPSMLLAQRFTDWLWDKQQDNK